MALMDTATAWKKSCFILLDRSARLIPYEIAFLAFAKHILTSLLVDEMLLLRYVNWSSNFRSVPLRVGMAPFYSKHMYSVLFAFIWKPKPLLLALGHAVGILLRLVYLQEELAYLHQFLQHLTFLMWKHFLLLGLWIYLSLLPTR